MRVERSLSGSEEVELQNRINELDANNFSGPFTPMSISEMFFTEIYKGDYRSKNAIDFWRNVPENLVFFKNCK